ncbi:hypothetical protein Y032_0064g3526 [Ancylostoma ceylanicum]|uniref:Uncharacterized protein n=1 Tax=Ancylostoma ceylanicum TaxID=53326 RepID=A0A016U2E8_9BILA|nr:hypothetical protein Y032_0064g3526 [Ancylostoma ceylanicum]
MDEPIPPASTAVRFFSYFVVFIILAAVVCWYRQPAVPQQLHNWVLHMLTLYFLRLCSDMSFQRVDNGDADASSSDEDEYMELLSHHHVSKLHLRRLKAKMLKVCLAGLIIYFTVEKIQF